MVQTYTEKVGQWSKDKALDIQVKHLLIIYLVAMFSVMALAFVCGLMFGGVISGVVGFLLIFTMCLSFWPLAKRVDTLLNQASRIRLKALRGGQAEAWVSMLFRQYLPDSWHLFDNLKLDANSDIDHILIGPGGFFVISTKSQRGLFQSSSTTADPTFNLRPCDWTRDATRQTMRLKDQLAVLENGKQPWIQTVLALPFAHVEAGPAKTQCNERLPGNAPIPGVTACWVLHEDTLLDAINPEPPPKPRKLSKAEIDRWAAAVEKLHERQS